MPERWRDIPGYEGVYQVSDLGRVRSLARIIVRSNGVPQAVAARILKPRPLASGHVHVALLYGGHRIDRRIHQLVMLAFVGLPPEGKEVCHRNEIHTDNRLVNLKYDTHAQNMAGTRDRRKQQMLPVERSDGARYLSCREAAEVLGVHRSSVSRSIRKGHLCRGFSFRFLEK